MAFNFITKSSLFKKINSGLTGKTIVSKGKRFTFSILYPFISDVNWQKLNFKLLYGKKLDLKNPKTYSEKVLFLKLFYQNPLLHLCADKHFVYDYVRLLGYENILIPELGIYNDAYEIDFDNLPEKFVMKCTQGSGGNLVVDKNKYFNKKEIIKYFNELIKIDYFKVGREFGYKGLNSQIMIQEYLENKNKTPLADYKFYCFNGNLEYYMVSFGEYTHDVKNHKFDKNNNSIDHMFKKDTAIKADEIQLPENIEEMKRIVEKLAKPFPHVRVDLYNIDSKIYFGELTFYSSGGFIQIYDKEYEKYLGDLINLEKYKNDFYFNKKNREYLI